MLGRSPSEYERLRDQARIWEPETASLLDHAGLAPGTRCLDVGCGPGETMSLMAERVGPAGHVTGIDIDATIGAQAIDMLHAAGHRRCTFEAIDAETDETIPGAPFDLVFARLLLLYTDDPAAALRRLWAWVAPGGRLVVQDYDLVMSGSLQRSRRSTSSGAWCSTSSGTAPATFGRGSICRRCTSRPGVGAPDGMDAGAWVGTLPRSHRCTRRSTAACCRPRSSSVSRPRSAAPAGSTSSLARPPERTGTPRCGRC